MDTINQKVADTAAKVSQQAAQVSAGAAKVAVKAEAEAVSDKAADIKEKAADKIAHIKAQAAQKTADLKEAAAEKTESFFDKVKDFTADAPASSANNPSPNTPFLPALLPYREPGSGFLHPQYPSFPSSVPLLSPPFPPSLRALNFLEKPE